MCECDEPSRNELEAPKDAVDDPRVPPPDDPQEREHDRRGKDDAEERREEGRDQHLVYEPVPVDDVEAGGGDRRADDPADERVARARGKADVPGDEVPCDRSDEAGHDDLQRDGSESTRPLAIVAATLKETKAPAKLRTADMSTASRGERARVETVVAIEFAVSWKPFVKSKKSATTTTATSVRSSMAR